MKVEIGDFVARVYPWKERDKESCVRVDKGCPTPMVNVPAVCVEGPEDLLRLQAAMGIASAIVVAWETGEEFVVEVERYHNCPGCRKKLDSSRFWSGNGALLHDVLICPGCGGLVGSLTPMELVNSGIVHLGEQVEAGSRGIQYFDLVVRSEDDAISSRAHGWLDIQTRGVVQYG